MTQLLKIDKQVLLSGNLVPTHTHTKLIKHRLSPDITTFVFLGTSMNISPYPKTENNSYLNV